MIETARGIEMSEWETREFTDLKLVDEDRIAIAHLKRNRRRIQVEELRSCVRISTKSSVGTVKFPSFELRILPKLAGDNIRLVEMIEVSAGVHSLRRSVGSKKLDSAAKSLLDLIALLLTEEAERIARNGMITDYTERVDELPVLRGRLLWDRQVLQRFGQIDKLVCRFDEREQDVPENQLIGLALQYCARRVTDQSVRRKARQLEVMYREVCRPSQFNVADGRSQFTYDRLNEHYRDAHELAWHFLEASGIRDIFETGSVRSFAFLLDMNDLFERFISVYVNWVVSGFPWNVHSQRRDRSIIWNALTNQPYARVIPDLLLETRSDPIARLAIDAKYKRYDSRRVASSDIYQAFLYAFAYGGQEGVLPATLVLYPASESGVQLDKLRIKTSHLLANAEVSLIGIHIPTALDEMRSQELGQVSLELLHQLEKKMKATASIP